MEFGNAYPIECKAIRKTRFDVATGELVIEDEFELLMDEDNIDLKLIKENNGVLARENLISREVPKLISDRRGTT